MYEAGGIYGHTLTTLPIPLPASRSIARRLAMHSAVFSAMLTSGKLPSGRAGSWPEM